MAHALKPIFLLSSAWARKKFRRCLDNIADALLIEHLRISERAK